MDTLFSIAPGEVTIQHLDVLKCILDILPFSTLMSLTGVNRVLRALILTIFNKRTAYFVSLFVPNGFTLQFFKLLHSTQACIVGSVVRCIITNEMYDHFKEVNPLQLNIVVPNTPPQADAASQRFRKWKRFLHSCGYSGTTEPYELSYNLRASCSQWYWTKMVSTFAEYSYLFLLMYHYPRSLCRTQAAIEKSLWSRVKRAAFTSRCFSPPKPQISSWCRLRGFTACIPGSTTSVSTLVSDRNLTPIPSAISTTDYYLSDRPTNGTPFLVLVEKLAHRFDDSQKTSPDGGYLGGEVMINQQTRATSSLRPILTVGIVRLGNLRVNVRSSDAGIFTSRLICMTL